MNVTPLQFRAARKMLGISMEELAEAAGVGASTISKFEKAKDLGPYRCTTLYRILDKLQKAGIRFTEGDVFFEKPEKPFILESRVLFAPQKKCKARTKTPAIERKRYGNDWLLSHVDYHGIYCLIWPFERNKAGYGEAIVNGKAMGAHRRMCELAHGPIPPDKQVAAHSCGKGHLGCCNPLHVRWATHKENYEDAVRHGTMHRRRKPLTQPEPAPL